MICFRAAKGKRTWIFTSLGTMSLNAFALNTIQVSRLIRFSNYITERHCSSSMPNRKNENLPFRVLIKTLPLKSRQIRYLFINVKHLQRWKKIINRWRWERNVKRMTRPVREILKRWLKNVEIEAGGTAFTKFQSPILEEKLLKTFPFSWENKGNLVGQTRDFS